MMVDCHRFWVTDIGLWYATTLRLENDSVTLRKGTLKMKKLALPIAFGVLACMAVGVAKADPVVGSKTTDVDQPWTIKAGLEWSTSSNSPTLGIAGIDYAFEKSAESNNPVLPSIYFDDTFKTSGSSANIADLGVAVRQDYRSSGGSTVPYVGAGIGAYYASTSGSSHTDLGGKVFGGVEFAGNWLVEANYTPRVDWNGANLSTYGVEVGLRF